MALRVAGGVAVGVEEADGDRLPDGLRERLALPDREAVRAGEGVVVAGEVPVGV